MFKRSTECWHYRNYVYGWRYTCTCIIHLASVGMARSAATKSEKGDMRRKKDLQKKKKKELGKGLSKQTGKKMEINPKKQKRIEARRLRRRKWKVSGQERKDKVWYRKKIFR